jgi:tRNA(adenine34) deaminase
MSMNQTAPYWNTLLALTEEARQNDEVPISAVLVYENKIIASAHNLVVTQNNPTLHAEMLVLNEGFSQLGKYLSECDLYVSLEPCPMCAWAIRLSQVKRLYFGAYDPKGGGVEHGPRLLDNLDRLQVFGGFHEEAFSSYLSSFFHEKRTPPSRS